MYFYINTINMNLTNKPVIGITCGDINGIGTELIIKVFSDNRLLEQCTSIIFSSNKLINFYCKSLPELNFSWQNVKELNHLNIKQVNIYNCWDEDVIIQPGQLNDIGGKYAVKSLLAASEALKKGEIHGMVTSPIHKKKCTNSRFQLYGPYSFPEKLFWRHRCSNDFICGRFSCRAGH